LKARSRFSSLRFSQVAAETARKAAEEELARQQAEIARLAAEESARQEAAEAARKVPSFSFLCNIYFVVRCFV
jgi:hypothetical protein